jgi:hypothetical protein
MISHLAIYGRVRVRRTYCLKCRRKTLVTKKGEKLCCGEPYEDHPEEFKVVCGKGVWRNRKPSAKHVKEMLEKYNYSCCYCGRRFGISMQMTVDGVVKFRKIKLNWDHFLPFSYAYNHQDENFLPSCSICNYWKRNIIFQTVEEVQIYVQNKWEESKAVNASV